MPELVGVIDPDQSPLAVQLVGLLVALQLIVTGVPVVVELGLTLSETTGRLGTTVISTVVEVLPLALPHVRVYE